MDRFSSCKRTSGPGEHATYSGSLGNLRDVAQNGAAQPCWTPAALAALSAALRGCCHVFGQPASAFLSDVHHIHRQHQRSFKSCRADIHIRFHLEEGLCWSAVALTAPAAFDPMRAYPRPKENGTP